MLLFATSKMHYPKHKTSNNAIKTDNGTCFNCRYQGTGSDVCKKCVRSCGKPINGKDNFKI